MNSYLSMKFKILSFMAIVMVIYIHMYYIEGQLYIVLGLIEDLIGKKICSIAVPMFYAISGYMFFLKMPDGFHSIKYKLKKRVFTLLIPYILANVFTFLFYVVLNFVALKISIIDDVINFKIFDIIENGLWPTIRLVFWDPPIAFQLWFIRNLMLVMLFSPLIWFILTFICHFKSFLLEIALFLLLFYFSGNNYIQALLWFMVGGYFAIHSSFLSMKKYSKIVGASTFVVTLILMTLPVKDITEVWVIRMIPIFAIPSIWILFDYFPFEKIMYKDCVKEICSYTFFIYLSHEPLLNVFKKLPLLISRSENTLIVSYITIPLVFILFACFLGSFLKRNFNKFYAFYTGGRM